ncbi:ATP-dependent helicase [Clostridia bacterium]|nr:ATP-dependent helicase [Clostridia bacterium]
MNRFVTKFDKEFLEIGYITVNPDLTALCAEFGNKISLTRADGVSRVFKVNAAENYIEGSGIVSFFKPYTEPLLRVERTGGADFNILSALAGKKTGEQADRTSLILSDISSLKSTNEKWFNLYEYAKLLIGASGDDSLQCVGQLNQIEKYQYQINTVKKVLTQFRGRVLLCDEVGLGKTIEACMAMTEYIMRGLARKILILTPASLVDQWYFETKTLFNQDFIRADDPDFKKGKDDSWAKHNKVIASISSAKLAKNSAAILNQHYDLVIVDEAHHLKNTKSLSWQLVNNLSKKYIFLLTATPVQNDMEELYNLITLLKPGQLSTYSYFKRNFVGDKSGLTVKNPKRLKDLLSSVMIRNKRSIIDAKLPRRYAHTCRLELSSAEKTLYNEVSAFVRSGFSGGSTVFTRFVLKTLQERMGSSFEALLDSLISLLENEHIMDAEHKQIETFAAKAKLLAGKVGENSKLNKMLDIINGFDGKLLIFTKYRKSQDAIVNFLKSNGLKCAVFNGSMKKKDKEAEIQRFSGATRLLVSTESGGEGRNLQFCNGMINFDLPWNPMAIEQRIGRIHRIGQEKDVYVYNLVGNETIERYMLELLDRKINMFELAIGEVDMILGDIDEKEDFGDIVLDAWTSSKNKSDLEEAIEKIGEKLVENKKRYERIKSIDDKIFSDLDAGEQ